MHPKFATQSADEQVKIVKKAFELLRFDGFFITMTQEFDECSAFVSALDTATDMHIKAKFHDQFGHREF